MRKSGRNTNLNWAFRVRSSMFERRAGGVGGRAKVDPPPARSAFCSPTSHAESGRMIGAPCSAPATACRGEGQRGKQDPRRRLAVRRKTGSDGSHICGRTAFFAAGADIAAVETRPGRGHAEPVAAGIVRWRIRQCDDHSEHDPCPDQPKSRRGFATMQLACVHDSLPSRDRRPMTVLNRRTPRAVESIRHRSAKVINGADMPRGQSGEAHPGRTLSVLSDARFTRNRSRKMRRPEM